LRQAASILGINVDSGIKNSPINLNYV